MIQRKKIDMKHSIEVEFSNKDPRVPVVTVELRLVKHENNTPIPDEEPTILFRGRDKLALPMLKFYKDICGMDGATEHQMKSIQEMIDRFEQFSRDNQQVMKQPGVTLGK